MGYVRTAEPAGLAVEVAAVKASARIDGNTEDWTVQELIGDATQYFERETGRSVLTTGWRLDLDRFPDGPIRLGWGRVLAISAIGYIDTAEVSTPMAVDDDYLADLSGDIGLIVPAVGSPWPTTHRRPGAVSVSYTAGYGAASAAVPRLVRRTITAIAAHWYANRESASVPDEIARLIRNYRIDLLG